MSYDTRTEPNLPNILLIARHPDATNNGVKSKSETGVAGHFTWSKNETSLHFSVDYLPLRYKTQTNRGSVKSRLDSMINSFLFNRRRCFAMLW